MNCVILAGGRGKRLRPHTDIIPKPLIYVGNKPCLDYILEQLNNYNLKENILMLHYKPEAFNKYKIQQGIFFTQIQGKDRGTAGALKLVENWVSDPFFVWNGDTISNIDLNAMKEYHQSKQAMATVFTHHDSIHSGGIYLFNKEVLDYIPDNTFYSINEDLIPDLLVRREKVKTFKTRKYYYYDIGTPSKLAYANTKFSDLPIL